MVIDGLDPREVSLTKKFKFDRIIFQKEQSLLDYYHKLCLFGLVSPGK